MDEYFMNIGFNLFKPHREMCDFARALGLDRERMFKLAHFAVQLVDEAHMNTIDDVRAFYYASLRRDLA